MGQGRHFLLILSNAIYQWLLLLIGLFTLSGLVIADSNMTEEDILGDIPMVMSATRLPQSVSDAPVAMTVIDREMIEASGFVEIPDLFRLVPGFQVGLSWQDHHSSVTYHGQSDGLSRRMQVLIDGRIALGATFGIVDWDRLGLVIDDIDRIEVVRGPSGVAYGSNAFIGAINIVTRQPFANTGWRMTATTGSRDTNIASVQYAEMGDKFDYRISASYLHTDGFEGVNDQIITRSGRFQGRYQFSPNLTLDAQFGYSRGPWGRGAATNSSSSQEEKKATESYGNFRLTQSLSPGNEWYFQVGMNSTEERENVDAGLLSDLLGVAPAQVPLVTSGLTDQHVDGTIYDYSTNLLDIEFQQLMQFGNKHRAVWGVGYRKDTSGGPSLRKQGWVAFETFRALTNIEYQLSESMLLNVGVIYEDDEFNKGKLSYRIGTNIEVVDGHVFRFSYSDSWRQPFLAEHLLDAKFRLADGTVVERVELTPETLDPEHLRSYELGYVGGWLEGRLTTEVKIYFEKFEDEVEYIADPTYPELVSVFNPGAILIKSGGSTDSQGIEAGMQWRFTSQTRLWLSYAFSEVDQHCLSQAFRCMTKNDATPRHTASLLVSHDFGGGWEASAGYYYLDDMSWILWSGDIETYDRVDVRVARTFYIGKSSLKLELIGQNLGGDYHEFNQNNVFETRTFVRASVQFD
jgi:iron complex outermembrane receptor protein